MSTPFFNNRPFPRRQNVYGSSRFKSHPNSQYRSNMSMNFSDNFSLSESVSLKVAQSNPWKLTQKTFLSRRISTTRQCQIIHFEAIRTEIRVSTEIPCQRPIVPRSHPCSPPEVQREVLSTCPTRSSRCSTTFVTRRRLIRWICLAMMRASICRSRTLISGTTKPIFVIIWWINSSPSRRSFRWPSRRPRSPKSKSHRLRWVH